MNYEVIETKLLALGIEFQPSDKYYSHCPKCSGDRTKSTSKSLMVTHDDEYVRYQCLHEGQCEWNERKYFRINTQANITLCPPDTKPTLFDGDILYPYKNIEGDILFYISRLNHKDGSKTIRPIVYKEPGGYSVEGFKGKALYNAGRLATKRTVLVVEGEKTADAAQLLFPNLAVVTWPGGCPGTNRGDWSLLKDKEVIIWPDNDPIGIKTGNLIASLIESPDISIVNTSGLPEKFDLADDITGIDIVRLLKGSAPFTKSASSLPNSLSADAFLNSINTFKEGLLCGFDEAYRDVRLPMSGLTIIAGRTGHGKTSLMVNLATHLLHTTDKKVVYYSYETPAQRLLLKLIMTVEGELLDANPSTNLFKYIDKIRKNELASWDFLKGLLNNRLFITDHQADINALTKSLDSEDNHGAVVFVDYIQLIGAGSNQNSRYLTIKHFADTLRELANKREMVIVAGSQLTSGETPYQDSVREGKDIENAAELVLKVWNKVSARANGAVKKEDIDYYTDVDGNFVVSVSKNRNGEPGVKYGFDLKFGCKLVSPQLIAENFEDEMEFDYENIIC